MNRQRNANNGSKTKDVKRTHRSANDRQFLHRAKKVCKLENPCECSKKNYNGKPYEGKLHVGFDEKGTDCLL